MLLCLLSTIVSGFVAMEGGDGGYVHCFKPCAPRSNYHWS